MAHSKTETNRILNDARAQAAIDRAEYFARPGATVVGWRGAHTVQADRRKKASKNACRGRVNY